MKHFEVTLCSKHYPMVYECNTIADAYGCIEEMASWVPGMRVDLSEIMKILVDMQRGQQRGHSGYHYSIAVKDEEDKKE